MVGVLVGNQDGIGHHERLYLQILLSEIRTAIDEDDGIVGIDQRGATQALVVRVGRPAHLAIAPQRGYAHRCSGT